MLIASTIRVANQISGLPIHLRVWLSWLVLSTLIVPMFFLATDFFAAAMVCQAMNLVFGTWLMLRNGLVRLLGLSHLLFWTPMLVKFWWFYDSLTSPLAVSVAWTMMITVVISLVFDFRDYIAWRRGARDPIGAKDIQRG